MDISALTDATLQRRSRSTGEPSLEDRIEALERENVKLRSALIEYGHILASLGEITGYEAKTGKRILRPR